MVVALVVLGFIVWAALYYGRFLQLKYESSEQGMRLEIKADQSWAEKERSTPTDSPTQDT